MKELSASLWKEVRLWTSRHILIARKKLFQWKQSVFTFSLLVPRHPLTATISDGSQNSPHKHLRFIHTAFAKLWQLEEKHLEGGLGIYLVYNLLTWRCIHWDSERGNGLASHQTKGQQMPAPSCLLTGEGNGNPLQSSCLENPMDGGAW